MENKTAKLQRVENGLAFYLQEIVIPLSDGWGKSADDPDWSPPTELENVDVIAEAAKKEGFREGWAACYDRMSQMSSAELRDLRDGS